MLTEGGNNTIDLAERRHLKYLLFGSLYFAEGLELALISLIVPLHLEELGFSIPTITFVAGITVIPWIIKFLWGGVVDYFIIYGRKRFIVSGAFLAIVSLLMLSVVDPRTGLVPFTSLLFLSHLGILFLDVSADAWAIEISREKERGKINGAMMAGNLVGISIGALFFAFIYEAQSFSSMFLIAGFLILLLILFPLFIKEERFDKQLERVTSTLIFEFRKKTTILIALFGFTLVINHGLHVYMLPLFEKTILHLDMMQIGALVSMGPLWAVPGVIAGGVLSDKFGRKKTLAFFIILGIVFSASLIWITTWEELFLYGLVMFAYSGFITAFAALAMDVTNPRIAALQFSILMSIANLGEWCGATISGFLVDALGYDKVFLLSAWILGPSLVVLYFIRRTPSH